jgi:hypothetical protein
MTAPAPLRFDELDWDLIVWGVAVQIDLGVFEVTAYPTAEDAQIAHGPIKHYADMVYHHPDRGWVVAATDENCRTL